MRGEGEDRNKADGDDEQCEEQRATDGLGGGNKFIELPAQDFEPAQVSPTRDTRLRWMQSVIHCTHYVHGAGERQYLNESDAPEITYIAREAISESDKAWIGE